MKYQNVVINVYYAFQLTTNTSFVRKLHYKCSHIYILFISRISISFTRYQTGNSLMRSTLPIYFHKYRKIFYENDI